MIISKIIEIVSKKFKKVINKLNIYKICENIESKSTKNTIENIDNNYLLIPSLLIGFANETTNAETLKSGKIEGINNKIKTLRRQAYGYPDDEYFFLKIFDISRTK